MKTANTSRIVSALILGMGVTGAHASGFQLLEQNASGLGNAYAGSAAVAENASTIFYNPAGMTKLEGINFSGGVNLIKPSFKFSNDGTTGPGNAFAMQGGDGGDAGSLGVVPNLYASWQLTPTWFVGLGIGAPFGLMTDYDDDWAGRFHSRKFDIKSVNINPSVAYKASDRLSLGFGINYVYLDAEYARSSPVSIPAVLGGGLGEAAAQANLRGDAWGWNVGLLYDLTPDTRLGVSYRSTMNINADGHTKLDTSSLPLPIQGALPGRVDASTSVKLPDTAILSLSHHLNSKWQLLADVSWTGWSSIQSLNIQNQGLPSDELKLEFRDTWRVALGASYHMNQKWTFKGGVAWDQSPIKNANYRPTSLPDNDRIWASFGAQYNFNNRTSIDVGYTHLFVKSTKIDNTTDANKGTIRGSYDSDANLFGVQISHRF